MSPAQFRVYHTNCFFCSSFTLDSKRKSKEITFQWIFGLTWLLRAMNFTLIIFSAAACSHWMYVTQAIFLPSMDATKMVLRKDLNALYIFNWIIALLQVTKMIDPGTRDKRITKETTTSPVSFAFALGRLHLWKLLFVFGFHIICKLFHFCSLFQIIGCFLPALYTCWLV